MELTFDNVYNLLESTEHTTETLQDSTNVIRIYNHLTKLLFNNFFPDYKIEDFASNPAFSGFKIVGPNGTGIYKDVTVLDIKHFYPTTIDILNNLGGNYVNIHEDTDPFGEEEWGDVALFSQPLKWNIKEYPVLFNFLLKNINLFREKSIDKRVSSMVNLLVNFTYGVAISGRNYIKCNNPSLIMDTINQISEIIQKDFNDYFIYCDSDTFYFSDFNEALPSLKRILDDWGYSYDIEKINYFLYIEKKRLIISETPFKVLGNLRVIDSIKKRKEKSALNVAKARAQMENRVAEGRAFNTMIRIRGRYEN